MRLVVRRKNGAMHPAPVPESLSPETVPSFARRFDPLHVLHNGIYVCVNFSNVWGHSLAELLGKCEKKIAFLEQTGILERGACGCTVSAYERGAEEERLAWGGRTVIVRHPNTPPRPSERSETVRAKKAAHS